MPWQILDSGQASAEKNMQVDCQLLCDLHHRSEPLLHLYEWLGDCATFGHFIQPEKFLCLQGAEEERLSLARRPTGGGIIFHLVDYAFSALVPHTYAGFSLNTLENYSLINNMVANVIKRYTGGQLTPTLLNENPQAKGSAQFFCMGKPTIYDVMLNGYKVGGAAQRRTKAGFLHQGSIAIGIPSKKFLEKVLLPNTGVGEAMEQNSCILLENAQDYPNKLETIRSEIKKLFIEEVKKQP